jgi:hypothetical protein
MDQTGSLAELVQRACDYALGQVFQENTDAVYGGDSTAALPGPEGNREPPPLQSAPSTTAAPQSAKGVPKSKPAASPGAGLDTRPIVLHPTDDRYISDFARDLGRILKSCGFYRFHGRAVHIRSVTVKARNGVEREIKKLLDLPVNLFSTVIETYCRPIVHTKAGYRCESITLEVAGRSLVCLDFVDALPEIKFWTYVRTPNIKT